MKQFYIISIGRSGTAFLSQLLNMPENAFVTHESYDEDYQTLPMAYYYPESRVVHEMLTQRFDKIFAHIPERIDIYGEVNSLLRYHVSWLKEKLNPFVFHLVRDGRDVVRSAYGRFLYTGYDNHLPIFPRNEDEYAGYWHKMSRFQKVCWYWKHTNDFISEHVDRVIYFEKLLRDYDYCKSQILDPVGLNIAKGIYREKCTKPKNTAFRFRLKKQLSGLIPGNSRQLPDKLPHWRNWDSEKTEQFWEICGSTMKKYNYDENEINYS